MQRMSSFSSAQGWGGGSSVASSGWNGLEDYRSDHDQQSRTYAARSVLWHKLRKRYENDPSSEYEKAVAVKKRVEKGMKEEAEIMSEYQKEISEW